MAKKLKTIIVDDNQDFRNALRILLERSGLTSEIYEASDGLEFVSMLNSISFPDLVLMDVLMPNVNGIEATRIAKKLCPNIKIIGHSSYPITNYSDLMYEAGASNMIDKYKMAENIIPIIQLIFVDSNVEKTSTGVHKPESQIPDFYNN